jgi:hypothetical protein
VRVGSSEFDVGELVTPKSPVIPAKRTMKAGAIQGAGRGAGNAGGLNKGSKEREPEGGKAGSKAASKAGSLIGGKSAGLVGKAGKAGKAGVGGKLRVPSAAERLAAAAMGPRLALSPGGDWYAPKTSADSSKVSGLLRLKSTQWLSLSHTL